MIARGKREAQRNASPLVTSKNFNGLFITAKTLLLNYHFTKDRNFFPTRQF